MKRTAFGLALLTFTIASAALADDAPRPDYSKETMLAFSREVLRQRAAERIDVDLGAIDVYKFGTHLKFLWLPFLAPLPGTRLNETGTLPNPFALTQTAIARSMPYMDDENSAAVNREIRRVLKLDKKRAKIKVENAMKPLLAALLMTVALPALAQDPDYSRQNLTRLFAQRDIDLPPRPPARVQWRLGYVQFRALGMDWRVIYLPLMVPLAGTRPNETAKLPDPFALTGTPLAGSRPFVPEGPSREVKREIRAALARH